MFFMALASSYIVRKGLGNDWQRTPMPRVVWFNTAILLCSSVTIVVARRKLESGAREAFRTWWKSLTDAADPSEKRQLDPAYKCFYQVWQAKMMTKASVLAQRLGELHEKQCKAVLERALAGEH